MVSHEAIPRLQKLIKRQFKDLNEELKIITEMQIDTSTLLSRASATYQALKKAGITNIGGKLDELALSRSGKRQRYPSPGHINAFYIVVRTRDVTGKALAHQKIISQDLASALIKVKGLEKILKTQIDLCPPKKRYFNIKAFEETLDIEKRLLDDSEKLETDVESELRRIKDEQDTLPAKIIEKLLSRVA